MAELLILWGYIGIVNSCIGAGVLKGIGLLTGRKKIVYGLAGTELAGIVAITVYAQTVSIFGKVFMAAHLILLAAAAACAYWCRKELLVIWSRVKKICLSWEGVLYLIFAVMTAYFASRGLQHTDTGIYHAQAIRWYEEYGLVKGLGNLQQHFAYNSAYLAYAAAFSMKWLVGQSLHGTNGFLQAFLCIWALYGLKNFARHKSHLADGCRVGILLYAIVVSERIMSPATDFGTMYLVFFIVTLWTSIACEKEGKVGEKTDLYALLCVAVVCVTTFKLSAGMLVILALYPAVCLIRSKEWKKIGIYLCIWALYGLKNFARHKSHLADGCRVGILLYAIVVSERIMSPATDFGTMYLVFFIVTLWTSIACEKEGKVGEKTDLYALLCVAVVCVTTFKLSAGMLVILALYPAVCLIRSKEWKKIGIYLLCGCVVLAPWLVRNVLISGWLIYPFAAIDLFSVDWKIPASYLQNDSDQIKVWGRCLYDVTKINDPVSAWFPVWWGEKDRYEMMLLIANMVAGISAVLSVVWKRIRKEKLCWDRVVVYAAVLGGIAGWFFLAPFIRYGLAFLLIFPLMAFGEWLRPMQMGPVRIASGFLCAAIFFSLSMYWDYYVLFDLVWGKQHLTDPAWVVQQDYDSVEVESFEMEGGLIVYYPAGGQENISYDAFPATAYRMMAERTKLRGSDIRDGFMPK